MKHTTKWTVSDSPAHELYIQREDNCDEESDGEFVFDTLKDAQDYCLKRIDSEIKTLNRTRESILKAK